MKKTRACELVCLSDFYLPRFLNPIIFLNRTINKLGARTQLSNPETQDSLV